MSGEKYFSLQAVVLRNRDYKEHDKLVHLFSLERGRVTVLAKGAGKPTGALRGLVQPFTQVNMAFARGRGSLDILTQGEVERPFITLRQDLVKIAYASYIAELTAVSMPEEKPGPEVFMLLLAAFSLLDMDAPATLTARFFELRLLAALGLAPRLEKCFSCGRGVPGGRFILSPAQGGLLCLSCAGAETVLPDISAGAARAMQHLLEGDISRLPQLKIGPLAQGEMEAALTVYLNYHLEQASKARVLLKRLLD